ncbi:TPR repeat-containing protein [Rippkaea orientalis PCC 8801]|uniref:TPR repeat-containing protein n=1 Tax=Rippkaea orientalis (strain PCC 8801 / RF-1) TaxID=41431 RepID=B7K268_RIPO1|nr:tetratricopeptide repeat protein [Rippkaea orientalis]ACK65204.1 TPR repeat-containing protein [Rippkaea orientalis PCC 8801]
MKTPKSNRNRWIYGALILMLLTLISFSMVPLVSSIVQARQPRNGESSPFSQETAKLENQALGYQLVLEREPDNQNALSGLLETKLRLGDLEGAITPLERLAQLNPQQPDYSILLAQAKQQLKDYEGAAAAYQAIIASNPAEIRALKGLVDLLLLQSRSQEAITLVQNTLSETAKKQSLGTPETSGFNVISLQLLLGEIYTSQNRYDEAIAVYDQAIETNGDDFRPLLAKAMILRDQGEEETAQTLLKDAILLAPVQYKEQLKTLALKSQKSEVKSQKSSIINEKED